MRYNRPDYDCQNDSSVSAVSSQMVLYKKGRRNLSLSLSLSLSLPLWKISYNLYAYSMIISRFQSAIWHRGKNFTYTVTVTVLGFHCLKIAVIKCFPATKFSLQWARIIDVWKGTSADTLVLGLKFHLVSNAIHLFFY